MKASVLALAGSLLGSAMAAAHHGNHAAFHKRKVPLLTTGVAETCGCTTYVTTIYGEATLVPEPAPTTTSSVESTSTITSTTAVATSTVNIIKTVTLPTPSVTTCPTPGTYTFPAKTLTVTQTTVVCAATTTVLPPGTQTYGGVTTTVTAPCTVTVPVAVVETTGTDVTSTIRETVTLCPSAGKCVVAPTTTVVVVETTVVYPVPTTFVPGTYTQPATTVTVTATDYVYVCPYAPVGAPTPTPAPITPAQNTPVPAPVQSSPPVQSTPETTKPGSTVGGGSGTISQKLNGRQWAMTYTPYQKNGLCKDATAVIEDIKVIRSKGFTTIRVYSTDCGALPSLEAAVKEIDIRLILGIFIDKRGLGFAEEQLAALSKWTRWDLVDLIVIGNESIFGGWISAEGLAAFIVKARSTLSAVGCKAKFTTTETLDTLQKPGVAGALCGVIDVVGANVQPYFTQSVSPGTAGSFVKGQLEIAKKLCGGAKEAYNLESGWPSYAWSANGNAVAGKEEQKTAILNILEVIGDKSVVFSYENDPWKDDGFQGVEKHFGCGWIF